MRQNTTMAAADTTAEPSRSPVERLLRTAEQVGSSLRIRLSDMFYAAGFVAQVLRETIKFFNKRQTGYRVLVMQILFTGVEALSIVSVLALALGAVISSSSILPVKLPLTWGSILAMIFLRMQAFRLE